MDRIAPDHEPAPVPETAGEADSAERAFAALCAEVAALRQGIELVYRQSQAAQTASGPDYSPTLGVMTQKLQAITARLEALEQKPALAQTPGQQAAALRHQRDQAGEAARLGLVRSQADLDGTVRALRQVIGMARTQREQRAWLWSAGSLGIVGGVLVWVLATAVLPWGAGTWLAGLGYGGRWPGGQALLREADPVSWERMVRLYQACPVASATAQCEAALAVRTAAPEDGPGFGTIRPRAEGGR